MRRYLVFSALVCACVGTSPTKTVTPDYQMTPSQGIVVGTFSAEQMRVPNDSPTLFVTVKSEAGPEYALDLADKGTLKSAFYVALPAGKYKFAGGSAGGGPSGARTTADWTNADVYFEVQGGQVTCVGAIESQAAEGAVNVLSGALGGSYKGKFKVDDACDAVSATFKQLYPALGGDVKKSLAKAQSPSR